MKLTLLPIFFIFLSIGIINAQSDFRPGYIVKNSNDTIFGQIDYRGDLYMSNICKFKNSDNTIVEYSPNDLAAFRFMDSKLYISREIDNKKIFLEYLIKGKVNIYYFRSKNGDHYYINKEDSQMIEIPYEEGISINEKNQRIAYESKMHIGILGYYMQDAPEIQSRIQSFGKPEQNSLIKLAEDYHNIVCKGEQCIIYEKKLPIISISIEPFAGVAKYKEYNNYLNEFGCLLLFWSPRANEKVYFKTGLVYQNLSKDNEKISFYKIPIQIQYIPRAHKMQPVFSGGFNFLASRPKDYIVVHTLSLNAGINYMIFNKVSISTMFNSDFTPPLSVMIDENLKFNLLSYSITVGLRIYL